MGYKVEWVSKVLEKALTGYENVLGMVSRGETTRNRLGAKTAQQRRYKKLFQHDWYKKRPKGDREKDVQGKDRKKGKKRANEDEKQETVMFIPYTQGSELKRKLQEMEESISMSNRWRYMEEAGASIASKLVSQDPWKLPCGRESCWTCAEQPGKCMKKGV